MVGLNCARGPATMWPILEPIRARIPAEGHVGALPVAYRTTEREPLFMRLGDGQAFPTGLDPYLCTRDDMGAFAIGAWTHGIRYIGVCCGAGPHHVRAMAEALGRRPPASRFTADLPNHGALGRAEDDEVRQAWVGRTGAAEEALVATSSDTISSIGPLDELPPKGIAEAHDSLATEYRDLVRQAGYVLPERMAHRFRELVDELGLSRDRN